MKSTLLPFSAIRKPMAENHRQQQYPKSQNSMAEIKSTNPYSMRVSSSAIGFFQWQINGGSRLKHRLPPPLKAP
jgi:hypothetical protein